MHQQEEQAKSYTGIFGMHKYWSKKPYNLMGSLILKNTRPNDIVLDPFCGSGISIIEAILNDRKGIGIDLNPIAIFITKQTLAKIAPEYILSEFKKIENDVKNEINNLYRVKRNNHTYTGTHFVWKDEKLIEIWYKNEFNKKVISESTKKDIKFSKSFTYSKIPYFYPKEKLIPNSRINAKESMYVYDLFTPRNLLGLSLLLDRINKIENKKIREIFQFCFTACLGQASKMVFVIEKRVKSVKTAIPKKEIGSWVIGYWVPNQNFEVNIWNCFGNRYNRIVKAKKEQYNLDYKLKYAKNIIDLKENNVLLSNSSALDYLKKLREESIDYIITDPPHSDRQPYLELSMMWNSWLRFESDFKKELIVSNAKSRDKTVSNYNKLFKSILLQISRVLRTNKKFTLIFNSLDDESWKAILEIINQSDLELSSIETMSYSANSVVQDNRKLGLETDFVLNFIKTSKKLTRLHTLSEEEETQEILSLINQFKKQNDTPRAFEIINHVIISLIKKGILFNLSTILKHL